MPVPNSYIQAQAINCATFTAIFNVMAVVMGWIVGINEVQRRSTAYGKIYAWGDR